MSVPAAATLRLWLLPPGAALLSDQDLLDAADLLDAIDALHQPFDNNSMCWACHSPHPCPTARLLHPEATDD